MNGPGGNADDARDGELEVKEYVEDPGRIKRPIAAPFNDEAEACRWLRGGFGGDGRCGIGNGCGHV